MKNEFIDRDIAAFVSQHLRDYRKLRKWKDHYDRIEAVLAQRAKGVFRWVECQFKELEKCPKSQHLLDQLLDSLPESLDETYERMLGSIASTWVEYSQRMLTLLCCAQRPLTVPELVDAIAVELGDSPKFNPRRRLEDVDAIHEVCPGFIEVDEQPTSEASTVRIAHFSVQEYLESERILQHKVAKFGVRKRDAHIDISRICLTYLLEPALPMSRDEYPLALYAARNWHEHLRDGGQNTHNTEHQALRLFQSKGGEFETWLNIWDIDHYDGRKPPGKGPSPIYYASLLGLDSVLSKLLCDQPSCAPPLALGLSEVFILVNSQGGGSGNALYAALAGDHKKIVQVLLERNADVNVQGGWYGNALQAASARGHEKIIQVLLERNADVNAQGGWYGNALQAASAGGHEKIVQLLLERNANVNAQGGEYGNALYAASYRGHEKVVQVLLERNTDVNAQNGGYGNALQAASAGGHEKVVQLLLERNANVNAQGGLFGNALQAASYRGREKVVQALLERNADVSAQSGWYENAVQAASEGGHEKIVQALLERNADVNAQGGLFGNALQAASAGGHEKVVQALVERNADDGTWIN